MVGYDLMVEPETKNHRLWNALVRKITQAIREVDPPAPILVGAADWSTVGSLDSLQLTGDARTVYVVHQYEPYAYSHQKRKAVAYQPEEARRGVPQAAGVQGPAPRPAGGQRVRRGAPRA